jgi:hypothetical protein
MITSPQLAGAISATTTAPRSNSRVSPSPGANIGAGPADHTDLINRTAVAGLVACDNAIGTTDPSLKNCGGRVRDAGL